MSVRTAYDEKRGELRDKLTECVKLSRELLNEDMWGYTEMKDGYAIDLYQAVKAARDAV